jgi:hypothetical protein
MRPVCIASRVLSISAFVAGALYIAPRRPIDESESPWTPGGGVLADLVPDEHHQ